MPSSSTTRLNVTSPQRARADVGAVPLRDWRSRTEGFPGCPGPSPTAPSNRHRPPPSAVPSPVREIGCKGSTAGLALLGRSLRGSGTMQYKTNIATIEVFGLYTDANVEALAYTLVLNCGGQFSQRPGRPGDGLCAWTVSRYGWIGLRSTVGPLVLPLIHPKCGVGKRSEERRYEDEEDAELSRHGGGRLRRVPLAGRTAGLATYRRTDCHQHE